MLSNFSRTVKITTNSVDYELFQDDDIKRIIKYRFGLLQGKTPSVEQQQEAEKWYQNALANRSDVFSGMNILIVPESDTFVSVNDEPYENNIVLLESVSDLTLGENTTTPIKSIKIKDAGIDMYITIQCN